MKLEIVFQDEALVAVNKPTRMLTVPGRGADKQDCLYHRMLDSFPDALVVHRLDMDTSGLVLFALSPGTQRSLSARFENRQVDKRYVAIVEGIIEQDEGMVDFPMRKDMEQRLPPKHLIDCIRGKQAVTGWRVLERGGSTTRMALFPKTGRSHQLRLHMQSIGHPVVGDPIYGRTATRLMLHAERLAFPHPYSGKPIRLECPAPF
jgi:tRNA pseudouridine32 synthase/23S rRNA pseudouridine746 synthase